MTGRIGLVLLAVTLVWPRTGSACPPAVMLWAWERPDDLSGLDPSVVGVAYLAKTLLLSGDGVVVRPRRQPLRLPEGAELMPVVRIEVSRQRPPALTPGQAERLTAEIAALTRPVGGAVQVDFDAARSQRTFYAGLLAALRARLPAGSRLSMTALASWTLFDTWISALPVDEAVPMLFRMGVDGDQVRRFLAEGGDVRTPVARASLGISTDEPLAGLPRGRRVYVFHPGPWTPAAVRSAIAEVMSWQGPVACSPS